MINLEKTIEVYKDGSWPQDFIQILGKIFSKPTTANKVKLYIYVDWDTRTTYYKYDEIYTSDLIKLD